MTRGMPMRTLADVINHEYQRISLSWHEAGHAVAAVVLGAQLRSAVVVDGKTDPATGAIGRPSGATTLDVMPQGRGPEIAYSGPWAQVRGRAGRRPTLREMHALWDTTGCKDHGTLCAAGGTATGAHVVPLLERCWPSVETLARKLSREHRVTHADVITALGLSADAETRSVELAMTRSGSVPGTFKVTPAGG